MARGCLVNPGRMGDASVPTTRGLRPGARLDSASRVHFDAPAGKGERVERGWMMTLTFGGFSGPSLRG